MSSLTPDDADTKAPSGDIPSPAASPPDSPVPPRRAAIPYDLYCQDCGYNLRTLTSDRCPECGRSLETVRGGVSQIPWAHRKYAGRFKAYWRTVWWVMFRQARFCEEMARPVSYSDSQRFRWVTILHVWIPLLLVTAGVYVGAWPTLSTEPILNDMFMAIWPAAALQGCVLLFLAAITGVPSYFFHPEDMPVELQNRAIALSYYASGPLAPAALPIGALVLAIAIWVNTDPGSALLLFGIFFSAAQVFAWWVDLIHLARRIMPLHKARKVLMALCLPASWVLLGGLVLIALPLAVFLVYLVFYSRA